jgi:hypothetical protein
LTLTGAANGPGFRCCRNVTFDGDTGVIDWETYDPTWLVELARTTRPDVPWLADVLATCVRCRVESEWYVRFVNPEGANEPEADWQFRESLLLDDPTEGNIVLDILQDGRVGGIEYYDRLFSKPQARKFSPGPGTGQ